MLIPNSVKTITKLLRTEEAECDSKPLVSQVSPTGSTQLKMNRHVVLTELLTLIFTFSVINRTWPSTKKEVLCVAFSVYQKK